MYYDLGFSHTKKESRTPMAQGRSTKIVWMIEWFRTSTLSIANSLSVCDCFGEGGGRAKVENRAMYI